MNEGDIYARIATAFLRFLGLVASLAGYLLLVIGGSGNAVLGALLLCTGLLAIVFSFPEFLRWLRGLHLGGVPGRPNYDPLFRLRIIVFLIALAGVIAIIFVWGISIGFYLCICLILAAIVIGEVDLASIRPQSAARSATDPDGADDSEITFGSRPLRQNSDPDEPPPHQVFVEIIPPTKGKPASSSNGPGGGTRFCPWCARMNPEDYSYCQRCGAPLPVPV
jgi:hypothetical protein